MAKIVRVNRVKRIKIVSGMFFVNAVRNEYARTDVVVAGIAVAASRTLETKGNRNESVGGSWMLATPSTKLLRSVVECGKNLKIDDRPQLIHFRSHPARRAAVAMNAETHDTALIKFRV